MAGKPSSDSAISQKREERRQDARRRSLSACVRAVGHDRAIQPDFVAEDFEFEAAGNRIADPRGQRDPGQLAISRGQSDAVALYHHLHDKKLHERLLPASTSGRLLFSLAEQMRFEALGASEMVGIAGNLDANLENHFAQRLGDAPVERNAIAMEEAVALRLRAQFNHRPLPPAAARALAPWTDWLDEFVMPELGSMNFDLDDQRAFADTMFDLLQRLNIETVESDPDSDDEAGEEEPGEEDAEPASSEAPEPEDTGDSGDQGEQSESGEDQNIELSDLSESSDAEDNDSEEPGAFWRPAPSPVPLEAEYQIFTTEFDEIVKPETLCEIDELEQLRQVLDQHIGDLQKSVGRFANRLQRVLLAQQNRSWQFDLEEGHLDTARLTRVLTDPVKPLSFKREIDAEFRDTVVTLLIDNSGSMHGRSIRVAAVCADLLSSTLERCGVRVEILGFTTCAWKGGQSREKWVKAGYPTNPGRLNDLRHIIYKSADTPWRRAKRNLGLMMRKGLLKENIDGEALQWAYSRLSARPEQRKILMMISDGAPIDDSTLSTNPGKFLEKHLKQVIRQIERQGTVELVAIGIGHDVGQYYSRATTIVDVNQLANVMTEQLVDLFAAS